ncbi:MAG: beta-galactosidase [Armatimonadota bacterium]
MDVTYDSRCFYDGDKPVWLVSGAMHYFRIPGELWEDRIEKAKLAGLNCIETYIAWNMHEPEEGRFDFTGDQDIDRFFSLVEKAGMYIIVRPGPYICAEWDNGGFPAWLTCKPGIRPRENDPLYLSYADRFFDRLLPIIADHQVTRGGKVILVQNENEYFYEDRPGGEEYLTHLNDKLRSSGIDVPIIACNGWKVPIPDTIECVNTWHEIANPIEAMRKVQPDTPKMVTEFWDGTYDVWCQPPGDKGKTSAEVVRRCCEAIGVGSMWNYYMWHGGTNFGFYAGQLFPHTRDIGTVTTSYDYYAPLSEFGGSTKLYLATKTANWMARNLGGFLCNADPVTPASTVDGPFLLQEMKSADGSLLVVRTQTDNQPEKAADLHLPDGTKLTVDISDYEAAVLPVNLKINGFTLDYLNGCLFSMEPLMIFGRAGSDGVVSIDGRVTRFTFPANDQPVVIGDVIVLSTEGVEHTWIMPDGSTVYGEGNFPEESGRAPVTATSQPPVLINWVTYSGFGPLNNEGDWIGIDAPISMDEIGHYFGYGWYRCEVECGADTDTSIYFPNASDRLLIFHNGEYAGTWGKGLGAETGPFPLSLRSGHNDLIFLADNMGRPNTGRKVGMKKGIWSVPGLDWETVPNPQTTIPAGGVPDEAKGQWELKTCWVDLESGCRSVVWDVDLDAGESMHLSISELQEYSYVLVNGELAHYHVALGSAISDFGFNEFDLREFVKPGANRVELRMLGRADESVPERVALYKYRTDARLDGRWSFMPFDPDQASDGDGSHHPLRVHRASFKSTGDYLPLFVNFSSLSKGQVYLNGRPLGRYWSVGPHTHLYIPEPWVLDDNELIIFEEQDAGADGVRLEY